LSTSRPEPVREASPPPGEPYVPAHLRFQQQQEQAHLRQQHGVKSQLVQKEAPLVYKSAVTPDQEGLDFICSTEEVDRYGDTIFAGGWELDNFKKNPVALFNHQHDWVVGLWQDVRVEKGALKARLKLAPANLSPRIDEVRGLIQHRFLRATSVGFLPLASEPIKGGLKYTKQELCEISITSVPANAGALAVEYGYGK
jgi:HK97 family phage prohead protease